MAVVKDFERRKRLHFPTLYLGTRLRMPVLATILKDGISSNRFVTLAAD
jgi:hypothetical protein